MPPPLRYATVDSNDSFDEWPTMTIRPSYLKSDRSRYMSMSRESQYLGNTRDAHDTYTGTERAHKRAAKEAADLRSQIGQIEEVLNTSNLSDADYVNWSEALEEIYSRLDELSKLKSEPERKRWSAPRTPIDDFRLCFKVSKTNARPAAVTATEMRKTECGCCPEPL